jgi:RNA polymerase sigma-70 factor (ECF subfamily)
LGVSPEDDVGRPGLEEVHARYGSWIRTRMRRFLGPEWEDAAQDVLLKLGPALANLRDPREEVVRALVSRTVRSVCIDTLRRRARRQSAIEADDRIEAPSAPVEAEAERRELIDSVRGRWQQLPERERRIVKLRLDDGLSFRAIAELLDVPQGSVAGWYSRALAQLREGLQ